MCQIMCCMLILKICYSFLNQGVSNLNYELQCIHKCTKVCYTGIRLWVWFGWVLFSVSIYLKILKRKKGYAGKKNCYVDTETCKNHILDFVLDSY